MVDTPKHGDDLQYPNLENISNIKHCSWPRSWMIFLFEEKMNLLTFFLFKQKNYRTLRLATAPYITNIFKIWVLGIIFMPGRVRSTRADILYLHTEGTEISNIGTKIENFCAKSVSHLCLVCVPHGCAYLGVRIISKYKEFPFE